MAARIDSHGRILAWNAAAERRLGYSAQEMIGSRLDLLDLEGQGQPESILRAASTPGAWRGQLSLRARDGTRVETECLCVLLDPRGRECLYLFDDRSEVEEERVERARLQEQVKQAQRMEAMGHLAAGIAHDFNNLLTSILGYAEILGGHFDPRSEESEDLLELEQAGRRAAALTRQLLSFSRQPGARKAPVNMAMMVDALVPLLKPSLGEGTRLRVEHGGNNAWVLADRSELEQVVVNLVLNARDALGGQGEVKLRTGTAKLGLEELAGPLGLSAGDYMVLSVEDNGCGMSEELRSRIFEPFFTTKEERTGTGLGLTVARSVVEDTGGSIQVESAAERGTCVRVFLPRVEPDEIEIHETGAPIPADADTILVVEDEPLVRRLICSGLREAGYVVLEASGGVEAMRVAEMHQGPILVLVTDLILPGEGGVELASHLLEKRPELQVLYISGYNEESILPEGLPTPGAAFLRKPFTSVALQARIHDLTRQEPVGEGS